MLLMILLLMVLRHHLSLGHLQVPLIENILLLIECIVVLLLQLLLHLSLQQLLMLLLSHQLLMGLRGLRTAQRRPLIVDDPSLHLHPRSLSQLGHVRRSYESLVNVLQSYSLICHELLGASILGKCARTRG